MTHLEEKDPLLTLDEASQASPAKAETDRVEEEETLESMADFMDLIDQSLRSLERGDTLEGKVIQVIAEGLLCDIQYAQDGFVHEQELSQLPTDYAVGQVIKLVVVGFSKEGQVMLSEKHALKQHAQEAIERAIDDGATIEGLIKEAVKGGFRVDIGGITGYMPYSLYQKGYLENPEALIGQRLEMKIEKADERGYVFTRLPIEAELINKAKASFYQHHAVGETVVGKVLNFNRGGMVVDVEGMRCFVPRSEMSYSRTSKPEDLFKEGDSLKLVIREMKVNTDQVILSVKDLLKDPWDQIDDVIGLGDIFEMYPVHETAQFYFYELEDGIQGSMLKKDFPAEAKGIEGPHVLEVVSINKERKRIDLRYYFEVEMPQGDDDLEESVSIGSLFGDKLKGLKFND